MQTIPYLLAKIFNTDTLLCYTTKHDNADEKLL